MRDPFSVMVRRPLIGLAILGLLSIVAVLWASIVNTDKEMRDNLLVQATVAAKATDVVRLAKLTGADSDLRSPDYIRIKEQMTAIRSASNDYRFVYLMGKKPNGAIFFYADSEPESSTDYSPPGQIYREATKELREIFSKKEGLVEGPVDDEWGSWVSALSPVVDPRTGSVIAVLGIDIAASFWRWDVGVHVLPSVGFMVLLFIGAVIWGYASLRRIESR